MEMTKPATAQLAYTVNQAAAAVGLGRTTIYDLIKTGELTPLKIRRRTLLRHEDLVALLNRMHAANS